MFLSLPLSASEKVLEARMHRVHRRIPSGTGRPITAVYSAPAARNAAIGGIAGPGVGARCPGICIGSAALGTPQRGVDQGCALASPVFGISTARPAERAIQAIRTRDAEASIFQYADDTQFHLDPDELPQAYEHVSREWAVAGLSLNRTKTKVWGPKPDTVLPAGWEKHRIPSMKCLGADFVEDGITATPPRHQEALTEIQPAATALETFAARLCQLQASGLPRQLSQALLRYAAVGGP